MLNNIYFINLNTSMFNILIYCYFLFSRSLKFNIKIAINKGYFKH